MTKVLVSEERPVRIDYAPGRGLKKFDAKALYLRLTTEMKGLTFSMKIQFPKQDMVDK